MKNKNKKLVKNTGIACALILVMVLSVLVRVPHSLGISSRPLPDSRIDQYGLAYFNQMDAYFHVRIADELDETGVYGVINENGESVDMLRSAPDGRSTSYQMGIIYTALALGRMLEPFGVELHWVYYWMSCLFAALTALAAFLLARRMTAFPGALLAGVLTACGPAFVSRTVAGSFDTDMMQLLLTVMLMGFMAETLRADRWRRAIVFAVLTAITAEVFTLFWGPSSIAFLIIALTGGGLYVTGHLLSCLLSRVIKPAGKPAAREKSVRLPAAAGYFLSFILTAGGITLLQGPAFIGEFFSTLTAVGSDLSGDLLPNIYGSVQELQAGSFAPATFTEWFSGYIERLPRETVVNGVGGVLVLVFAAGCLLWLAVMTLRPKKQGRTGTGNEQNADSAGHAAGNNEERPARDDDPAHPGVYLCVLGVWLFLCVYAAKLGVRFVEHISAPAGILAGCLAGKIFPVCSPYAPQGGKASAFAARTILGLLACLLLAMPCVSGAFRAGAAVASIVSDASEETMDWINENAQDPDAVIASWWDLGYYYEYEARHPVLWDGGSQDAVRALVLSHALVCDDPVTGRNLLLMLSSSGSEPLEQIAACTGLEEGCRLLWKCAAADRETSGEILKEEGNIPGAKAEKIAGMIHPTRPRETYLVLTRRMMMLLGWIEYYANWDFSGEQEEPVLTGHLSIPDGSGSFVSAEPAHKAFFEKRMKENIWSLYFSESEEEEEKSGFKRVYEAEDDLEKIRVWRVD